MKEANKLWKLTITQKRKSDYSDYMVESTTEFLSDSVYELGITIGRLSEHEEAHETSYKIEKVGENDGI